MTENYGRLRVGGFSRRRLVPLAVIVLGAVAAIFLAGDYLNFETLRDNRESLIRWRDLNYALAVAAYMGVYIVSVAFSAPGAVWLTLSGGFLFGAAVATGLTVVAATIGAAAIFLAARAGLGDVLRARAGPSLRKLEEGFHRNEVSFLLLLRLVPAVPFFVANLAPAFLGVKLRRYVWTTFIGIIPGTAVYAWLGAGLGEVFARGGQPDLGIIFEPRILGPLLGLSLLAAVPVVIRKLRGKGDAG